MEIPLLPLSMTEFILLEIYNLLIHVPVQTRLKKIQEKKKIIRKKAEEAKKAKGITNGKSK